jgi:outer membrane protein
MLSLDAKEDKRRDMDKKRRYYQYLYEDLTQEMKNAEMEATKQVTKELEKVVDKLGKSEGYKLILERKAVGIIYFDDAIDMTNRVIDAYDRMK